MFSSQTPLRKPTRSRVFPRDPGLEHPVLPAALSFSRVAEIFRSPDLQAALYFAFFMLTDPPTAPTRYQDQILFAAIVAASSFALFEWLGVVYYLSAGLLVGNAWEAWRRARKSRA